MDQYVKDLFQIISWAVGIIGGLIAAFRAVFEMGRTREQRIEELKWKRAKEGKEILAEISKDTYCKNAMLMLDWSGREYLIKEDMKKTISTDDMLAALRIKDLRFNIKEAFIRDCFDRLFEKMEELDHFISIQLIDFKDIKGFIEYYVNQMNMNRDIFVNFMQQYGYNKALALLQRFDQWEG